VVGRAGQAQLTLVADDSHDVSKATASASASAFLEIGTVLGRYVIVEKLGAGGMGVVYGAYDPELKRRVALKLFHLLGGTSVGIDPSRSHVPNDSARSASLDLQQAQMMLLQEAKAAAKVNDPNVVAVYDAGVFCGRVFMAMEYVRGESLRTKVRSLGNAKSKRTRTLDWLRQSLLGLNAVHRAGLVHADFKPDNAIVGDDTVVRLVDFGLARAVDNDARPSGKKKRADPETSHPLGGTLSYIAPELLCGSAPSRQSDIFAWGVTAYELLCGVRPFVAGDFIELQAMHENPTWATHAEFRSLPSWLQDLLSDALARDPAQRPNTVFPMLEAWDRAIDLKRSRLRWLGGVFGASSLMALIVSAVHVSADNVCEVPEIALDRVWNHEQAEAVSMAFSATGSPWATSAAQQVDEAFTTWRERWSNTFGEICGRGHSIRGFSNAAFDHHLECLRDMARRTEHLSHSLAQADARVVERAAGVADTLEDPQVCAALHLSTESNAMPIDPVVREQVTKAGAQLEEAEAWMLTGNEARSAQRLDELSGTVHAIGWAPLLANFYQARAHLSYYSWDYHASLHAAQQAYVSMRATGDHAAQMRALSLVLASTSYTNPSTEELRELGRLLDASAVRNGSSIRDLRLAYAQYGAAMINLGDVENAERALLVARALQDREGNVSVSERAGLESNLACARTELGRPAEAELDARSAVHRIEQAFGKQHPELGRSLYNLASSLVRQGRVSEAAEVAMRGRTILETAHGPWTPRAAPFFHYWLDAKVAMGRDDLALRDYPQVVPIYRKTFGPHHQRTQWMELDWAHAMFSVGDLDGAKTLLAHIDPSKVPNKAAIDELQARRHLLATFMALAEFDDIRARALADSLPRVGRQQVGDPRVDVMWRSVQVALALVADDRQALHMLLDEIDPSALDFSATRLEHSAYMIALGYLHIHDLQRARLTLDRAQSWMMNDRNEHDARRVGLWQIRALERERSGDRVQAQAMRQAATRASMPHQRIWLQRLADFAARTEILARALAGNG
jgi:serine/threonine protein kinase/tetratricopeptide (TPR) repeat protein